MLGTNFYHGTIRKYIILFGSLFNDIYIDRVDAEGNAAKTLKVPISYGPKERYIARALQNPDLLRPISMTLPRISFEINTIRYASERKLNSIGRNANGNTYKGNLNHQFNPVPYDFDITMSVITRNADDGTRIVEQILPYFTPEWTVAVKLIPDMNIEMDIPIILKSVSLEDAYEGNFETKQFIIWTMVFTLKGYIYGPISRPSIIKQVEVNLYTPDSGAENFGINIIDKAEYMIIQPGVDANGNSTTLLANSIPLSEISANSDYGYITEFFSNY
jgi:hypothetical protein